MDRQRTIVGALGPAARPRHPLFSAVDSAVIDTDPIVVAASGGSAERNDAICLMDGFLFNREELAAILGLPPTHSDERLVGEAYLRWGEEMPDRLRGEFTVFVWVPALKQGLIARHRSGTRPMFICAQGSTLYFASEIGELVALLPRRPAPDDIGVARALGGWTLHDDRTLFEGVRRLGAGSLVRLEARGFSVRRYWCPQPSEPVSLDRKEAVEEIQRLIGAAVNRRVGSNDEAGILLSGGLDSSTVAAIGAPALATRDKKLRGYSAQFPDAPSADESAELDVLASGLKVPQVRMTLTGGSPLAAGIDYLQRWAVPLGPPNHFVWQPFLCHAASHGVTVMLDGDGGDEVFTESPYLVADRLRRIRLIRAARLARTISGAGAGIRSVSLSLYAWGVGGLLPSFLAERDSRSESPMFRPETARLFREGDETEPWRKWQGPRWWAHRAHAILQGPESLGVQDYMHRRATMAGLASRHPLLDVELVDFILSLPPEWSFDPVFTRPLLREAGAGLVPEEVRLKRRKAAFGPVFGSPLGHTDLPVICDLIGSPGAEVSRYVLTAAVERNLLAGPSAHPFGEATWAIETWRLANVECWLRMQENPESLPDLLDRAREGSTESRTFFSLDDTLGSA